MRISWDRLLCSETVAPKEKVPKSWVDYPLDPFERDYREIILSVSFRRLQDKSQVYQFGKGDFVRTRLTHSLEVSTIAKQLGNMLIFNEKWNHIPAFQNLSISQARAIPTVLACSGLLHDLGNPPFGHEGEDVIGSWFRTNLFRSDFTYFGKPIGSLLSEQQKRDLCTFEGNAQVIRTLSRCRFPSEEQEANVTYATMSTLIKYPANSLEKDRENEDPRIHKFSYYASEEKLVKTIREKTGMDLPDEPHARNPLTFLLEAADDIAYVTSDIEDAVVKKSISVYQLTSFMRKKIDEIPREGDEMHQLQIMTAEGILNNLLLRLENCEGDEHQEFSAVQHWTEYVRNWLMYVTATSFVNNWETIMNGTHRDDLLRASHHRYTIKILKAEMYQNVYPLLADIHAAAYTILSDLIGRFARAVAEWDTEKTLEPGFHNYIQLIPEKLRNAYHKEKGSDEIENLYLRLRMVNDFISGMTDGYALELYQKLNAIFY